MADFTVPKWLPAWSSLTWFRIGWVVLTAIGWGVGGYLGLQAGDNMIVNGFMGLSIGAMLAGVFQSLLLRGRMAGASWWSITVIGALVLSGIVIMTVRPFNADGGWVLGVGLFGFFVGGLQWLIRKSYSPGAGWWVLASTLGWIAAMPIGGFVGWAGLGAAHGVFTSLALPKLLHTTS